MESPQFGSWVTGETVGLTPTISGARLWRVRCMVLLNIPAFIS